MIISVTQNEILRGWRWSAHRCPIALAAHVQLGFDTFVVGREIVSTKGNICGRLPESALNFMRRFDMGEHVTPFSFEIEFWPIVP